MVVLRILQGKNTKQIPFEAPARLMDLLTENGSTLQHPCGGNGRCGKCAVLSVSGAVSAPDEAEARAGMRLSCRIRLLGDAEVELPVSGEIEVEVSHGSDAVKKASGGDSAQRLPGKADSDVLSCAVDIGTTTLAITVYSGDDRIDSFGALNPQTAIAADVMGRIGAAMKGEGETLKTQITELIRTLLSERGYLEKIDRYVITGNTTMLYLLTGEDPVRLSAYPFEADDLFDREIEFLGRTAYLPKCMHAFVGADITCSVLASGMCDRKETSLLCDVGTNGEIALWKDGRLYVSSTAAGPAFEGAGISCGCQGIPGAVEKVTLVNGDIVSETIGGLPAVGICGSGLIDAVAAFLHREDIDETGAIDDDLPVTGKVKLTQSDIRSVQLAKAAVCAGILTVGEASNTSLAEIATFYIAGGFGSHLNTGNAAAIGLFPAELAGKAKVIGNAALAGASMILCSPEMRKRASEIAAVSEHVNLGGSDLFNDNYIDCMMFE